MEDVPQPLAAAAVRVVLARRGWTVYRLAAEAGLSQQTVWKVLDGAAAQVATVDRLLAAGGEAWALLDAIRGGRVEVPPDPRPGGKRK